MTEGHDYNGEEFAICERLARITGNFSHLLLRKVKHDKETV